MSKAMSRVVRALAVACVVGSTAACATVTRGVHETWSVETDPSGAQVKTSNGYACDDTPCTFQMERKSAFDVTISKAGYKTWKGHVAHSISNAGAAGMAGNIILGGLVGGAVDVTSGAMMDLKPNPLKVPLEKDDKTTAAASGATAGGGN